MLFVEYFRVFFDVEKQVLAQAFQKKQGKETLCFFLLSNQIEDWKQERYSDVKNHCFCYIIQIIELIESSWWINLLSQTFFISYLVENWRKLFNCV